MLILQILKSCPNNHLRTSADPVFPDAVPHFEADLREALADQTAAADQSVAVGRIVVVGPNAGVGQSAVADRSVVVDQGVEQASIRVVRIWVQHAAQASIRVVHAARVAIRVVRVSIRVAPHAAAAAPAPVAFRVEAA
jgi:hypothetical protein